MHNIQKGILNLLDTHDLNGKTLREIAQFVGESHPQKIKHHLEQLEKKGFIIFNPEEKVLRRTYSEENPEFTFLFSIPIMGTANCGPATFLADDNREGYIKVSKSMIRNPQTTYALKADGESMNQANIDGLSIDSGDYVLIDSSDKNPQNGGYFVAVYDHCANIKRIKIDKEYNQVSLISESSRDFPPIIIHQDDLENLHVAGRVVKVIKN